MRCDGVALEAVGVVLWDVLAVGVEQGPLLVRGDGYGLGAGAALVRAVRGGTARN